MGLVSLIYRRQMREKVSPSSLSSHMSMPSSDGSSPPVGGTQGFFIVLKATVPPSSCLGAKTFDNVNLDSCDSRIAPTFMTVPEYQGNLSSTNALIKAQGLFGDDLNPSDVTKIWGKYGEHGLDVSFDEMDVTLRFDIKFIEQDKAKEKYTGVKRGEDVSAAMLVGNEVELDADVVEQLSGEWLEGDIPVGRKNSKGEIVLESRQRTQKKEKTARKSVRGKKN